MKSDADSRLFATRFCSALLGSLAVLLGCDSGTLTAPEVHNVPIVRVESLNSESATVDRSAETKSVGATSSAPIDSPIQKRRTVAVSKIDSSLEAPPLDVRRAAQNAVPVKIESIRNKAVNRSAEMALTEATTSSPVDSLVEKPRTVAVSNTDTLPQKPQMAERVVAQNGGPVKTELTKTEPVKTEPVSAEAAKTEPVKKVDPSDEFFQKGLIPEIRITLTEKEEAQLRRDLRRYVDVTFTENGTTTYKKVKMKLKGAAGSFRDLNDRPALTVSIRGKGERFHGLEKFHLNNSVQDESYLNELIASELCHDAGLPAARTTHARVWLNGRDLGFYVLKEGMDERFVKRHFKNAKGNFYDGAFCADIDAPREKEFGDGPEDRSDLKEVIDACREGDQTRRWQRVEEKVAIDDFINFAAMELMMCHWDGYCQNRNNYRIYFPADDKKIRFLPHGMDQMFGDINFGVFHVPGPIVASAVLQNPTVHTRYRHRVRELLPLFAPEKFHAKIDAAHARIRPVLAAIHEDRARQFDGRVTDYKNRVAGRVQAIKSQFPPEPIAFNTEGWALAEDWVAQPQGDAKLESLVSDGNKVLSLTPGTSNQVQASFRTKVRLARGTYRFDAKVKTSGVVATPEDKGYGAGVRLGGGMRKNNALGTTDWQTVSHEFEIGQDLQEVELVAELRSTAGSALFDLASLRVYKLK